MVNAIKAIHVKFIYFFHLCSCSLVEKDEGIDVATELSQKQEEGMAPGDPPSAVLPESLSAEGLPSPAAPTSTPPTGVQQLQVEAAEPAVTTSTRKWQLCRQLSKNKEGATHTDMGLLEQKMFVSIQGNQFKRNGKGDFGTFLY